MNYADSSWYLVQCKPRESFRAEMHLQNQGFECFHPTRLIKKNNSGTIHQLQSPLFPFYLFVSLNSNANWSTIRSTRGVKGIVCFDYKPALVSQIIIDGIKHHCGILNSQEPTPLFQCGDKVVIKSGCFKELEATVMAERGEDRVMLLLSLFNRQQELEFHMSGLEACS